MIRRGEGEENRERERGITRGYRIKGMRYKGHWVVVTHRKQIRTVTIQISVCRLSGMMMNCDNMSLLLVIYIQG